MYSVKAFGAIGNGIDKDTEAIQKAIDKCASDGGGRVIFERGVYLAGTLCLRSNVELHLMSGAKIQGSSNPNDYYDFTAPGFKHEMAAEGGSKCLICAYGEENVSITGSGEINGAGPTFYDTNSVLWERFYDKPKTPRPRMIIFYKCRNVKFEDTSFVDSPCWTFWLINCQYVNIHRIKVIGDQKMINNDGIDIDSCRYVTISDSFLKTGDDCLILRAVQEVQDDPAICEDVTVNNCVLDSCCQGIRVGCPGDNVIRNCAFSNLIINGAGNGINIDNPKRYLPKDCAGLLDVHNILFSNININCSGHPIRIFVEDGIKLRRLSGFSFSNFRIRSGLPCLITGCKETIINDIIFNDIKIETVGKEAIICRDCRGIKFNNVELADIKGEEL